MTLHSKIHGQVVGLVRHFFRFGFIFVLTTSLACADTLLVLGDSLSAAFNMDIEKGWVHLLEQTQRQKNPTFKAINASVGGETSAGGLKRLPQLLDTHKPTIVLIELGGNDGLRGYPVKKLKTNLQAMIDLSLDAQARVIIAGIQIPPNYGKRYSQSFFKSFQEVAASNRLEIIDFFLEDIALNPDLMQADGIHPNEKAQPLLAKKVAKKLNFTAIDNQPNHGLNPK